ncbi:MAG: hypothetical protein QME81_02595 [bacterium]|nr:hypothetical protein [bacterium]
MLLEPTTVALKIISVFEELGVPYFIGGSLASAIHGVVRATNDVDIVADLKMEHVLPLKKALQDEFYIDEEMIKEAIKRKSSFNIIYLEWMFKVDIFVLGSRPYVQEQLRRRYEEIVSRKPEQTAYIATREDTILSKLEWYRMGGEVSDRQWSDVLGVIKVQGNCLDMDYLNHWANKLNLDDLLKKALDEAGTGK